MRDVFCGLDFVARVIKRRQERNKHTRKENNIHFEIVSKNIISLCIDIQELLEYKHKNDFFCSGGKKINMSTTRQNAKQAPISWIRTSNHLGRRTFEVPAFFFSTKGTVSGLQVSRQVPSVEEGLPTNQLPTNHQRRPFLPERAIKTCYLPLRGR